MAQHGAASHSFALYTTGYYLALQSHFVYPPVSEHGEYSIFAIVNNTAMSTGTEVLHSFIFYQQKYLAEKSDLTENITLGKYYLLF